MLLRKWRSNSKQLNLLWQQEGVKTESSETSAIDLRPPTKVLGLAWDPENDLIYFDPKNLLKFMSRRGESKRFILSVVGRIFDPIGILGPFVIKLKCLLQELWTLGVEWDSELPPKLRHKWQQWSSEAEGLTEIKIPRFYLAFKPYIKNRVQEIQLLSDPMQWGHCPGKDNPADLLSRGTSAVKLAQNELWWHGPPWLKLTPDHWPNRHRDILDSELCSEEFEHRSSVHVAVTQQREALVDINRFSSLKKLLKTTAWVFRFVNNARNIYESMDFYITADEGIHWKFIVERAPWWGGFYERLVKTIKDPLRKILGRALLTFEELSTILSEVEVIVNHRPLTYVENDPGEPEPLTPAHFLEIRLW
ncbi:integrase catalytic domain-containing protein [Trichonephila clavipes]|nr:integrase catalytic domain-containing protein [Trichonephila clavipes]